MNNEADVSYPAYPAQEAATSGVSWAAIFAGAASAAALSLILLVLGAGLGFSAISPWSNHGIDASTLGKSSIIWLAFTQIAAGAIGGYLAGRLRTKWAAVHTDEVYFRDTAHGLLSWAIATLTAAAILGSAVANIASTGATATAAVATGAGTAVASLANTAGPEMLSKSPSGSAGNHDNGLTAYTVDSLFRVDPATATPVDATLDSNSRAETGRILVNGWRTGSLSAEDKQYLAQVVAKRTGMAPADAEKRVTDLFNKVEAAKTMAEQKAREAADQARKAAAYAALWVFIGLLCGAFVAALAATLGGKRRDAAHLIINAHAV
ncbi:hypothetical protein [Undibacterium sp. TJN19]|uniref:hypothetical protein n=1 Tax=Undibacterium sp. TJN19 TaxID=3413055 RepID=UPI003BF0C9CA